MIVSTRSAGVSAPPQAHPLTTALAGFVAATRFEDLPPEAIHGTKRLILDTLGCAYGATRTESGRLAVRHVQRLGGHPRATVLGSPGRTSATNAAYANGRMANVLDADDTFPTGTHFASTAVFAALALAEEERRSGRDLIRAVAVGFDLAARVGSWMGAPVKVEDGRVTGYRTLSGPSATMTWAAVGSSAAVAGLDAAQAANAFGIAGANTPLPSIGKWAEQVRLPMHKYADAGWCAQAGLNATMLAEAGSTGFAGVLDGDTGFWRFFGAEEHDDQVLLHGLGANWQILNTTYKPWPSCRWTHYPLTAFLRLKREHGLTPERIESVIVRANPFALSPRFKVCQPDTPVNAQFSHAHVMAMGAFGIPPGPLWYAEQTLGDPAIAAFRERVSVEPEPRAADLARWIEEGQFRRIPASVEVHTPAGVLTASAEMAWGDPWSEETYFTDEALRAKFRDMLSDDGRADQVIELIDNLEEVDDLGGLCVL